MGYNKIKGLAIIATILCINSIPVIAHADDNSAKVQTAQVTSKQLAAPSNYQASQENSYQATNYGSVQTIKENDLKGQAETKGDTKLDLKSNWLTKEIANELNKDVDDLTQQDLLSIKKLDLHDTRIDGIIPEEIGLLTNLEYLNLNGCRLYDEAPEAIGSLSKLTYLDLGNNKIKGIPDNIKQKIANGSYSYCDIEMNDFSLDEGWYFLKGKWCYLNSKGDRLTGSQTVDGKQYEFSDDGTIKFGWETVDGKRYYYDKASGMAKAAWKLIDGKWYYFNEDGVMQKGLQTIKGVKYFLDDNGAMVTGWKLIWGKWYSFSNSGGMQYGWITANGKSYYLDATTGVMAANETKTIDGKSYRFDSDGSIITNVWLDTYTYVQPNGDVVNTYSNYSHSNTNYQLFKYMTDENNEASVDSTAVLLHGGVTSNNCVYFTSEALRRIGVGVPTSTANTYQLESQLQSIGFVASYDFSQIKPGDVVFTNGYTHVYIFMCWDTDGYAYIVDNQGSLFGGTLHRRKILEDTAMTDRATHFFYYPN